VAGQRSEGLAAGGNVLEWRGLQKIVDKILDQSLAGADIVGLRKTIRTRRGRTSLATNAELYCRASLVAMMSPTFPK
jgi:hypothetical protein